MLSRQQHGGEDSAARIRDLEQRLQVARDAELEALAQLSTSTSTMQVRLPLHLMYGCICI